VEADPRLGCEMSPVLYWLLKAHFPRCAPRWVKVVQIIETACVQERGSSGMGAKRNLVWRGANCKGTCASDNLLLLIAAEDTDLINQGRGCG